MSLASQSYTCRAEQDFFVSVPSTPTVAAQTVQNVFFRLFLFLSLSQGLRAMICTSSIDAPMDGRTDGPTGDVTNYTEPNTKRKDKVFRVTSRSSGDASALSEEFGLEQSEAFFASFVHHIIIAALTCLR